MTEGQVNLNAPINLRYIIGVAVLAGLGVAGFYGIKHIQAASRGSAEAKLEVPEIQECKRRLALFYDAWTKYRSDHQGHDPVSVEMLMPKYISDPNLFVCPTAARLEKAKIILPHGYIHLPNKGGTRNETYGFKWLSAGFPLFLKHKGDQILLITCSAHREAAFFVEYRKLPMDTDFDRDHIGSLPAAVRGAPLLAIRRNGKVEAVSNMSE
jgi:hypothetical protein